MANKKNCMLIQINVLIEGGMPEFQDYCKKVGAIQELLDHYVVGGQVSETDGKRKISDRRRSAEFRAGKKFDH